MKCTSITHIKTYLLKYSFLLNKILFICTECVKLWFLGSFVKGSHLYTLVFNMSVSVQFSPVQSLSHVQLFVTQGLQHARPPCPSPTSGVYSNLCPLSWWCHPTISSYVIPFSCHQSFPASGSFLMSRFFASGGQSIEASASASALAMNIQDWFPLGWTGWISLQSKRLSRVFSNTTIQKHQFFGSQLSL